MELPKRKRIRLDGYDYSKNGVYFITICTEDRINLFGEIVDGVISYNEIGKIACVEIENTNKLRDNNGIQIKKYIVMPNHVHMIIEIVGSRRAVTENAQDEQIVGSRRAVTENAQDEQIGVSRRAVTENAQHEQFAVPTKQSIPTIIRAYKSAVTKRLHELDANGIINESNLKNGHGTPCPYKIWQSRFHDHIIRNDHEYSRIWEYIDTNPLKWDDDCFNSVSANKNDKQ